MPEEKKDKKATPFLVPAKEAKKESFTFSDKIKESKSGGSKSFANRISSKIGRDGKPKQTIFERTKRDAPFLIAALVALLLLPFLYKYSGSVSDGEKMITPGNEEQFFDPNERYAFASDMGDPDQIAQLSGRDSLDLIRSPYASEEEEMTGTDYKGSYDEDYRDAFGGSKTAAEDTNVDIEENTTNIYKKRAKASTRAAFKRAATKINGMPSSGLRSHNGDKLAVGNWGGSLKGAAKKVKGNSPVSSPKPVSLQPLQAAAKPSRSAFGNTAAAMRQSKDALSKADAKQALRDADVAPVGPGSFGGMTIGEGNFGSGSGDLKRNFNYQGKEPWWWDLLKTRSQKAWEAEFERKWNWIKWGDEIAQNILKGLINCVVTGNSDGDPDTMLGSGGGSIGKKAKCCGLEEKYFKIKYKTEYDAAGGDFEMACGGVRKGDAGKKECPSGWEAGRDGGAARVGIVRSRLNCLGLNFGGKYGVGAASLTENAASAPCEDIDNYHYTVVPTGAAMKWHIYHYVVARNYVPLPLQSSSVQIQNGKTAPTARLYLCTEESDHNRFSSKYSSGSSAAYGKPSAVSKSAGQLTDAVIDEQYDNYKRSATVTDGKNKHRVQTWADYLINLYSVKDQETKESLRQMQSAFEMAPEKAKAPATGEKESTVTKTSVMRNMAREAYNSVHTFDGNFNVSKKQQINADQYRLNPENERDACVIYLAQGDTFEYGQFQHDMTENLQQTLQDEIANGTISAKAIEESYGSMEEAAKVAFEQLDLLFIESVAMDDKLGYAKWGKSGNRLEMLPMLYERFKMAYIVHKKTTTSETGSRTNVNNRKYRVADEEYIMGEKCYFNPNVRIGCIDESVPPSAYVTKGTGAKDKVESITLTAEYKPSLAEDTRTDLKQSWTIGKDMEAGTQRLVFEPENVGEDPLVGAVLWKAEYQTDGVPFTVTKSCPVTTPGLTKHAIVRKKECENKDESAECCEKMHPQEWKKWEYVNGECKEIKEQKENADKQNIEDQKKVVRFAPIISWVPTDITGRTPIKGDEPAESDFTPGLVKPAQQKVVNNCGSQVPLVMDSQKAKEFTTLVSQKYNDKYKADIEAGNRPALSEETLNKYPTDGEFIDALNIADTEKLESQVSAAAVCELARDMVRMSRDKDVGGDDHADNPNDPGEKYHNELGAFLAYVHGMSMLYPATKQGNSCDERFLAYNYMKGTECHNAAQSNHVAPAYHYNNYNGIEMKTYTTYKNSLAPEQKAFPLAELGALGPNISYENCGICTKQVNQYNSDKGYELMYRDNTTGNGTACEAFAGNKTMSVANALKYVQGVCKVGLDHKPNGAASTQWKANQQPTKKGGGRTSDKITQPKKAEQE